MSQLWGQRIQGVAGVWLAIIEWSLGLGDGVWGALLYSVYFYVGLKFLHNKKQNKNCEVDTVIFSLL